jgi:molybdopterin-guanine dinucleotide biosynthesis protein A
VTRHQQHDAAPLPPVYGGILIGGGSTRMGMPKHLLRAGQRTFLELVVAALEPCVSQLVLLGAGELPDKCAQLTRLPDPPDIAGPLAGMLAAMRWNPDVAWLFAACDMPLVTPAAVAWLLEQRSPERVAVLPRLREGEPPGEPLPRGGEAPAEPGSAGASPSRSGSRLTTPQSNIHEGDVEPLLALYEPQTRPILEGLAESGYHAPHRVAEHGPVFTPSPPADLARAWQNVNTPADLENLP